ncbi:MBL fold metallo-hydrolase [Chloroflexota bacterium]
MEITWLGHSCFRIKGKEVTLVADPCDKSIGYSPGKLIANIVTVSHDHAGHCYLEGIENSPKVLSRPGEYEVGGVFITGIGTFHDQERGKSRGKNTSYLIEIEDIRLCHLGDLGHVPSPRQIEDLGSIDVLFVPVGGVSTIDAKIAAEIVRLINPKIIIPMHYRTQEVTWLEPLDKFIKEMGLREVVPQPKLSVTRLGLPLETQVIVLDYRIS